MSDPIVISFRGRAPSRGEVKAYTSFESMLAISQALTMVLNFADTGSIRRKKFAELDFDLRLVDTREGSFEFILEHKEQLEYIGKFALSAAAGGLAWDIIKGAFLRVIGGSPKDTISELEKSPDVGRGDIGALIQALEPAIRRAHTAVGRGANSIKIYAEGQSEDVLIFDRATKEYLNESVENDEYRVKRFMITSFDGRARTGRAFDLEDEQGYTFELQDGAGFRSLRAIADAARSYALRSDGRFSERLEIVARFSSKDAPDGRIKKMYFWQVARDMDQLDPSDY